MAQSDKELTLSSVISELKADRLMVCYPKLAEALGSYDAAIAVQQVYFWSEVNRRKDRKTHFHDGRWWCFNTLEDWAEEFRVLSVSTIKRLFAGLRKAGVLLAKRFSRNPLDRRLWYAVDTEAIERLLELKANKINDQTNLSCCIGSNWSDDLYTENTDQRDQDIKVSLLKAAPEGGKLEPGIEPGTAKQVEANLLGAGEEINSLPEQSSLLRSDLPPLETAYKNQLSIKPESDKPDLDLRSSSADLGQDLRRDEDGWARLPEAGRFKLQRFITVRRLQYLLSLDVADPSAKLFFQDGHLVHEAGEFLMEDTRSGRLSWEHDFFAPSGDRSLRQLRNEVIKAGKLSQERFNAILSHLWKDTLEWCIAAGDRAVELLSVTGVATFAADDYLLMR